MTSQSETALDEPTRGAIVSELGPAVREDGGALLGRARSFPEVWVPGTSVLRASVLATWADVLAGLLTSKTIVPRIPVTVDLTVETHRPIEGEQRLSAQAVVVKAGRTLALAEVWFRYEGEDDPVALAQATFMASPNPAHVVEGGFPIGARPRPALLTKPFAERAGLRVDGNAVEVPFQPEGLNASGGINGGLVALVAEEAALASALTPSFAQSLSLRYLRPFTAGPARATAAVSGPLARVQVVDAGDEGKLGTVATLRLAPAP